MGEGFAFFHWVLFMVEAEAWPFYDGCGVCQWNCWKDWEGMNGSDATR